MSFFAKKSSGRRAFLRRTGGGVLGLPLLEFTHAKSWAQSAAQKRFVTIFSHGGTVIPRSRGGATLPHQWRQTSSGLDLWHPSGLGDGFMLNEIHQPIAAFRNKMLFVSGIDNMAANNQAPYGGGGHGTANVTCLTCADYRSEGDDAVPTGASIDKLIAERLAARQPVPFESLHLLVAGHQYGSPYYRASGQVSSGEKDPIAAFNRIFEGVEQSDGPDPRAVRSNAMRRHVLNGTVDAFKSMRAVVSQHDRQILDAHFDHLSSLSSELEALSNQPAASCSPPSGLSGGESNAVASAHAKIIVAALRCGLTNVANLEISDIVTPWTPSGTQVESAYNIGHSLGHIQNDTGQNTDYERRWALEMKENRQWRMSVVREILEGLDDPAFAEGGSTMLDNSIVYYTSEFSAPAEHSAREVPTLVVGSAGGALKQGTHVTYNTKRGSAPVAAEHETNASYHNLYTTFLQALGESDNHFGNDDVVFKGPLAELLA